MENSENHENIDRLALISKITQQNKSLEKSRISQPQEKDSELLEQQIEELNFKNKTLEIQLQTEASIFEEQIVKLTKQIVELNKTIEEQKRKINHMGHSKIKAKKEVNRLNSMIDELNQSYLNEDQSFVNDVNTSMNRSFCQDQILKEDKQVPQ